MIGTANITAWGYNNQLLADSSKIYQQVASDKLHLVAVFIVGSRLINYAAVSSGRLKSDSDTYFSLYVPHLLFYLSLLYLGLFSMLFTASVSFDKVTH